MLGPTTRPVEKRGSSTVNVPASPMTVQREVAAQDEPAAQRGHPRQRRALAQPGEDRMSVRRGQGLDGDCDLLVVGGGVMGLFTAYHASERVGRVVVLERGRIGDPMTASFGRTRSFRNDYLDATYARLAHEAFRLWGAFELQTATKVLVRCGCLNIAKRSVTPDLAEHLRAAQPRDPGAPRPADGVLRRARRCGERFPFLDADIGRLDCDAGVVDLPAVTGALLAALAARGVRILEGVETIAVERDGERWRVITDAARAHRPRRSSSPPGTAPTTSSRCCPTAACRSRSPRTGRARRSTSSRPRARASASRRARCRWSPTWTPGSTATRSSTGSSRR